MADAENQPKPGTDAKAATEEAIGTGFAHRHLPSSIEALGHQGGVLDEEKVPRNQLGTGCPGPDPSSLRGGRQGGDVEASLAFVRGLYREQEVAPVGQELRPAEGRLLPRFVGRGEEPWLPSGVRYRVEPPAGPSGGEHDRSLDAPRACVEFLGELAEALNGPAREGDLAELSLGGGERDRRAVRRPEVPSQGPLRSGQRPGLRRVQRAKPQLPVAGRRAEEGDVATVGRHGHGTPHPEGQVLGRVEDEVGRGSRLGRPGQALDEEHRAERDQGQSDGGPGHALAGAAAVGRLDGPRDVGCRSLGLG